MATSEAPPFWFEPPGVKAWLLAPVSLLYSSVARINMAARPSASASVPVLCVGNFVAGGGGKTPTALALGKAALARGLKPGFLSRGYGGRIGRTTLVEPGRHVARDVGDEPLLLAALAPTVVSPDRVAGAERLAETGCDFIIMDDGFQNPRLRKDFNLVVVDSVRGVGNGFAMPAGPLRVRLGHQIPMADALLVVGGADGANPVIRKAARAGKPIHQAFVRIAAPRQWKGRRVLAFAGIADPSKLFESLRAAGADLVQAKPFGDHHPFLAEEIDTLLREARELDAQLVTTAKDMARLRGMGKLHDELADASQILEIDLVFEDRRLAANLIEAALARFEQHSIQQAAKEVEN